MILKTISVRRFAKNNIASLYKLQRLQYMVRAFIHLLGPRLTKNKTHNIYVVGPYLYNYIGIEQLFIQNTAIYKNLNNIVIDNLGV